MGKRTRRYLRAFGALIPALATLWTVAAAAPLRSLDEAVRALDTGALSMALIRFERGALFPETGLSFPASSALRAAPLLYAARDNAAAAQEDEPAQSSPPPREDDAPERETEPALAAPDVTVRDNGVPSTTLRPSDASGYLARGSALVHNTSASALTAEQLGSGFSAKLTDAAPQVLIVHTHGCEAYTMPPGEEYAESDDHRTLDERYNVLRVGDEIERVLTDAGIGVLHDRTLHDYPNYSGAYNRSLATVERYRAEHPSLVFILDVHRDAVADANGKQYKLLCAEEPNAAQLEFVVGSDGGGLEHPRWRDNLALACAVQETILNEYPTLMRPIIVRNSRYNQQVTTGSLLLEVGTAGNSLDEALIAARLFAEGFVKTLGSRPEG